MLVTDREFLSSIWDAWIIQTIAIAYWLSFIDNVHSSLMVAWCLCCCDIAFLVDALVRGFRQIADVFLGSGKVRFKRRRYGNYLLESFASWFYVFSFVSLVPYHILVVWQMDYGHYYLIVCLMRLIWILQEKRFPTKLLANLSKIRLRNSDTSLSDPT